MSLPGALPAGGILFDTGADLPPPELRGRRVAFQPGPGADAFALIDSLRAAGFAAAAAPVAAALPGGALPGFGVIATLPEADLSCDDRAAALAGAHGFVLRGGGAK